MGLRLHPRTVFVSKLLIEDGGAESSDTVTLRKGQVIVQAAYLDWLENEAGAGGARLGHQQVPLGRTNTNDDPLNYFGVRKPELEQALLPPSWHENGVSLWLDRDRVDLQVGAFNALDARVFARRLFSPVDALRVKTPRPRTGWAWPAYA
ncbi:MAG: hypothetical protein HC902_03830 [Calothrix sp. SM1_5_4]|nr:hypothetical protein [Calothrix sp. SM1_5_4]